MQKNAHIRNHHFTKILRVMRITTFFITAFCLHVSATGLSQTVTLKGDKLSLKAIFSAVEQQTGYVVLYTEEAINAGNTVSVSAQDMPLLQFLEAVLPKHALGYEIKNKTIVIVPESPQLPVISRQPPVTGILVDAAGKTLAGATVTVKGTGRKTVSDDRGRFSIAAGPGQTLVVTSVGFTTREINVGTATQLGIIALDASTSDLDEVNVVAYGTTTRRETTGSVSTIKGKELEGIPASNISNLLQGRVAGMDVTNISGSPGGGGIAITIRGYNSLDVEQGRRFSNPLWVVDGVPLNSFTSPVTGTNMLADINPDMIESIQILKDASSASLYGSRAANGVIIVTTKKGQQNQKAQFSANVSQTYSVLPRLPTVMIGKAERDFRLAALRNHPGAYLDLETMRYKYPESFLENYRNPNSSIDFFFSALPSETNGLDLQDSLNSFYNNATNFFPMYYETGKVTNANIQTYGGAQNMSYGIGLGYYDEKGVLKGSGFERIDLNSNLNVTPTKKLTVDLRFNASLTNRNRGEQVNENGEVANMLIGESPIIETVPGDPFKLSSLYPGEGSPVWEDILERLSGTKEKNRSVRLRSNFKLGYDILQGLNVSSSVAADYSVHRRNYFRPSYLAESGRSRTIGETGVNLLVLNENLLSYRKTVNEHHNINAIAGLSYQYDQVEFNGAWADNSPSDKIYYARPGFPRLINIDNGGGNIFTVPLQHYISDMEEKVLLSYFGRIEYNFKQKYLLSASFRQDGSSVFGSNNKWGTFPAIAAGWVFSEENWLKENLLWLNFGKFRASWGKSGMHFSQNYLALGIMQVGIEPFQGNAVLVPEYNQGLYNESLTWEETDQYDFGLDIDVLDQRLSLVADYYYRYTDKMLMPIELPGDYNGYRSQWRNAAAVSNEGVELLIKYEVLRNQNKYWKVSINGARNWNRFEKSYDGKDVGGRIIGKPLNGIYAYPTNGFVNEQESLPIYFNAGGVSSYFGPAGARNNFHKPGDYAHIDVNGNGELDGGDQVYIGSALPFVSGGLVSEFRWNNFDVNLSASYQIGRHMLNLLPLTSISTNPIASTPVFVDLDDISFWQMPGDNQADYSELRLMNYGQFIIDNYIEKVSWLKLKTLTIGYNITNEMIRSPWFSQVRVFASGENLFAFSNYSGLDPETVSINTGYDSGTNYPLARKLTMGITLKF